MSIRSAIGFVVHRLAPPPQAICPSGGPGTFVKCSAEEAQYWLVFDARNGAQLQGDPETLYLQLWNDDVGCTMDSSAMTHWDHDKILLDLSDWYKAQTIRGARNVTIRSMGYRCVNGGRTTQTTYDCPVRAWEAASLGLTDWDFVIEDARDS